jgi:hypothetical protein
MYGFLRTKLGAVRRVAAQSFDSHAPGTDRNLTCGTPNPHRQCIGASPAPSHCHDASADRGSQKAFKLIYIVIFSTPANAGLTSDTLYPELAGKPDFCHKDRSLQRK